MSSKPHHHHPALSLGVRRRKLQKYYHQQLYLSALSLQASSKAPRDVAVGGSTSPPASFFLLLNLELDDDDAGLDDMVVKLWNGEGVIDEGEQKFGRDERLGLFAKAALSSSFKFKSKKKEEKYHQQHNYISRCFRRGS
ncbi:hypothetical protein CCACVL1_05003 [Corchorus capsularis]|uniref:Uncharacterized protein n=1 Tax=Corchorus capsularis TaxID=210143 RepID=A0A1R3JND7_COCAP|nr:hypothetical protein CCACVL1_05003 [Corchorus capsularis]